MSKHDDEEFGYATIDVSFAAALDGTDLAALEGTPELGDEASAFIGAALEQVAEKLNGSGTLRDVRLTLLIDDVEAEAVPAVVTMGEIPRMRRALALALLVSDDDAMSRIEKAIHLASASAGSDAVH